MLAKTVAVLEYRFISPIAQLHSLRKCFIRKLFSLRLNFISFLLHQLIQVGNSQIVIIVLIVIIEISVVVVQTSYVLIIGDYICVTEVGIKLNIYPRLFGMFFVLFALRITCVHYCLAHHSLKSARAMQIIEENLDSPSFL